MPFHPRYETRMLRKYRVETRREQAERILLPLVCRVRGHVPMLKLSCTICWRCRVVLEER